MNYKASDFPIKCRYKRNPKRIYFATDFRDNELLEFSHFHSRPNSFREGLAVYKSLEREHYQLINIRDVKEEK